MKGRRLSKEISRDELMNMRASGVELNPDYFRDGVAYLREADQQISAPTLFDLLGYA